MNINIPDLLKLKDEHWMTVIFVVLSTLAPGTLIFYVFKPELFISLSFAKLVLLAISITLPVVILNAVIALPNTLNNSRSTNPDNLIDLTVLFNTACLYASIVLYPSIAVAYFFSITFRQFCLVAVIIYVVIGIWNWGSFLREIKKKV